MGFLDGKEYLRKDVAETFKVTMQAISFYMRKSFLQLIRHEKAKSTVFQGGEISVHKKQSRITLEQKEKINKTEEAVEEDSVQEDTGVIRVSDILKAVKSKKTEVEKAYDAKEETDETESAAIKTTDKTAMIENVLPMPKKHVGRSFDYSFEPSTDMMHYDVELENDDYDYE